MNYAVLGAGRMGQVIADDLVRESTATQIYINDVHSEAVDSCLEFLDSDICSGVTYDVTSDEFHDFLTGSSIDVVVNALPHELSVPALETCIEANVDAVDLAYEDDQWELAEDAAAASATIIPGCGVAPGLSNMLAGYGASKFDNVEEIVIQVGGLPTNPRPPLEYRVVFHLDSVWNEYTQPARVIRKGETQKVDPLSEVNKITFENTGDIGELESFPTDGLGTLLETFSEINKLEEQTIRYPGHARKIQTLRECGLFDTNPIKINGTAISPRTYLTKLLTPCLTLDKEEQDFTALRVNIAGEANGQSINQQYELVDYYDKTRQLTSMARTTGYTASIVAQLVANNSISIAGLVPPEQIGRNATHFETVYDELMKRNITINGI